MYQTMPKVSVGGGSNSESKEEWDGIIAHGKISMPLIKSSHATFTINSSGSMTISSGSTNNYGHFILFDVGKKLKDFNTLSFTGYASGVYSITGVFVVQKSKLPSTIATTESITDRIKVITLTTSNKTTTYALSELSDEVRNDECYIVLSVATSTTTNYPMTFTDLSLIK